jgi:NAD(P)-dependent dehydrogenase (short-subunit alcohol dehydrogenase family)
VAACIAHHGEWAGLSGSIDAVATVLIIGASRGIGLETVKAALEAGHSVRALARSARRIPVDHPKLEKMAGEALDTATVKRALIGIDVVIQSLGVRSDPKYSSSRPGLSPQQHESSLPRWRRLKSSG